MAKQTLQQQNLTRLKELGWEEFETRSSKYIALKHPSFGNLSRVFLGKAGAVRVGRTASATVASSIGAVVFQTNHRLQNPPKGLHP